MKRFVDGILVCAYLLVVILPIALWRMQPLDVPIDGALPKLMRPPITAPEVWHERFQHRFVAWFEDRMALKSASIYTDNSILYHVFGETKPGASVRLGLDGVLYQPDDLYFYSKYRPVQPSQAQIDAFAAKLARVQGKLRARGRALVPIIIPAKTTIYRNEIPSLWQRPLAQPHPTDVDVYQAFRAALDAHGVAYVDARALFTTATTTRAQIWAPQGRHWTDYGACLALREVATHYTRLSGKSLAPYGCELTLRADRPIWHQDYDLYRLLNAWGVPRDPEPTPTAAVVAPAEAPRPSALVVGSSFGWHLIRDLRRSGSFGALDLYYYNTTIFHWADDQIVRKPEVESRNGIPIDLTSPTWRATTLDKDLYVLDLFEAYLIIGTYSVDFVDQLDAALGP